MAKEPNPKQDWSAAAQLSLHAVKQVLGNDIQESHFSSQHEDFSQEFGVELRGSIERFGIDLSETESRIMEAIIYGFSTTSYKGNIEYKDKADLAEEKYNGKLPSTYKYIEKIPRLRVTQAQILDWAGISRNSVAAKTRAVDAITSLSVKQYCFYYDRLAYSEEGVPLKDKSGKWKKENVYLVDTLFTIKQVRDENEKLKYYEIMPSSIFLDQRESYFMLVPYNWREDVRRLYGDKKASSYTFRFLLFLRYQYELKRRAKNQNPPYQIRWSPQEIAKAIKMPDSIVKRKKQRMLDILNDAYSIAKKLDYITDYEQLEHLHILTLHDNKYFSKSDLSVNQVIDGIHSQNESTSSEATRLFALFHETRQKLDPQHQLPSGIVRINEQEALDGLLKTRTAEQIEQVIKWSTEKRYWCSRLSTINKLRRHFSEAWAEFQVEGRGSISIVDNKTLAEQIERKFSNNSKNVQISALGKYIEIGQGPYTFTTINYEEKGFKDQLENALRKWELV